MNKKMLIKIGIGLAIVLALIGSALDEGLAYATASIAAAWFAWNATKEDE